MVRTYFSAFGIAADVSRLQQRSFTNRKCAKLLFERGLPFLLSRECMDGPHVTGSSVLSQFTDEISSPLVQHGDTDAVSRFIQSILSATNLPWNYIAPRQHTAPDNSPPDDEAVTVLPRTSYSALNQWIDGLNDKLHHLINLRFNAC